MFEYLIYANLFYLDLLDTMGGTEKTKTELESEKLGSGEMNSRIKKTRHV